jgi:prevent-host-death family protein
MALNRESETVVSATDAKNKLGSLLGQVAEHGEAVIIERQGKPRAAIISIEEYRLMRELQRDARRREAIASIRRIRDEISEGFKDLTQEEIDAIAQEVRDETLQALVNKHLILSEG